MATMRDSYFVKCWITGEVASFLESQYPDHELNVAVPRALGKLQSFIRQGRGTSDQQLRTELKEAQEDLAQLGQNYQEALQEIQRLKAEVAHARALAKDTSALEELSEKLDKLAEGQPTVETPVVNPVTTVIVQSMPQSEIPDGDWISKLQTLTQQRKAELPIYHFNPVDGGFECICQCLDVSEAAIATNKKAAKRRAAYGVFQALNVDLPEQPNVPRPKLKKTVAPRSLTSASDLSVQRIIERCDGAMRPILKRCSLKWIDSHKLQILAPNQADESKVMKRQRHIQGKASAVLGCDVDAIEIQILWRPLRAV